MAIGSRLRGIIDELIATGFPDQVAERIATGELPMDTASRMQRAEAMGFDPSDVQYHGTLADIKSFIESPDGALGAGVYTTNNPDLASLYAQDFTVDIDNLPIGANILPVLLRGNKLSLDEFAKTFPEYRVEDLDAAQYIAREDKGITGIKEAKRLYGRPGDVVSTFDASDIRSVNAAFDPQYKGANILGGAATAAVGAGLLAAPEEAEAGFVTRGGKELLEAYHGSPHIFDRFSLDAIGTGEGAQAYGHGLYFADLEGVAKDYRDELTRPRIQFAGKDIDSPYTSDIITEFKPKIDEAYDDFAQGWVDEYEELASELEIDYDPDALAEFVELVKTGQEIPISVNKGVPNIDEYGIDANDLFDRYQDIEDEFVSNLANISQISILDDIDYVRENSINNLGIFEQYIEPELAMSKNEGALYRVEIDTRPDQLLDYDKPLSEQPQAVQDAMRKAMQSAEDRGMSQQLAQRQALADLAKGEMTGQQAYESLSEVMHPFMGERGDVMASQALKDQGLLGIRYDDRISRNRNPDKVEGTSNYVIFDDAAINIAERGAADPRLLALMAGGSGAGVLGLANESVADTAARLRAESDTSGAYAPRSGLLQNVTMAARDLERRLEGSPASLLFPSGYIQHLEEFNRPYERSTYTGALLGALDFL